MKRSKGVKATATRLCSLPGRKGRAGQCKVHKEKDTYTTSPWQYDTKKHAWYVVTARFRRREKKKDWW